MDRSTKVRKKLSKMIVDNYDGGVVVDSNDSIFPLRKVIANLAIVRLPNLNLFLGMTMDSVSFL